MAEQDGTISRRTLLGLGATGAAVGLAACSGGTPSSPARAGASGLTGAAARGISSGGRVREYWIQADAFRHNLVPSGSDEMMGNIFKPEQCTYWALGYRAYSPNWAAPLDGDADIGPNTGIPGPVIRAEVGDTVVVHFRNNDTHYAWPHSIHTHGVRYQPSSDGSWVQSRPTDPRVPRSPRDSRTPTPGPRRRARSAPGHTTTTPRPRGSPRPDR